jgi:hypothetical protein
LLIVAGLVGSLMPDLVVRYLESFAPVMDCALKAWGFFFSRYGDFRPWIVLGCLIASVFISGPLLLLTWIGQMLAKRCAATLPRYRLRIMTSLVSLAFACVALAICATPQSFAKERDVHLSFDIVDKDSGGPLSAAFLRITDPFDRTSSPPRALTGLDGHLQVLTRVEAVGEGNAFRSMGEFSSWGRWLEISAMNYQTAHIPLSAVLGPRPDLENPRARAIRLTKGVRRRRVASAISPGSIEKPTVRS